MQPLFLLFFEDKLLFGEHVITQYWNNLGKLLELKLALKAMILILIYNFFVIIYYIFIRILLFLLPLFIKCMKYLG